MDGKKIIIGGPRLLIEDMLVAPPEIGSQTTAWEGDGRTVLYLVADKHLLGAFAIEDEIRSESREAITELHRLGIRVRHDHWRFKGGRRIRRPTAGDR